MIIVIKYNLLLLYYISIIIYILMKIILLSFNEYENDITFNLFIRKSRFIHKSNYSA
jgi:hypothetical protein